MIQAFFAPGGALTHETVAVVHAIFSRPAPAPTTAPPLALEISGDLEDTDSTLDAAFDSPLSRADAPVAGPSPAARGASPLALVRGYDATGRTLFTLPVYEKGPFRAFVGGLDAVALDSLRQMDLLGPGGRITRSAGTLARAGIEAISIDPDHVLLKWDGREIPELRVHEGDAGPVIAIGNGSTTFSQLTFATRASRLFVELSDGLHSTFVPVKIFGR